MSFTEFFFPSFLEVHILGQRALRLSKGLLLEETTANGRNCLSMSLL